MIDEDFRTLLVNTLPVGVVVEKGKISQEQIPVRVYFQRSQENNALDLDGTQGLAETVFDVEVAALNDDATVQTIAAQVNAAFQQELTTLSGAINSTTKTLAVASVAQLPADGFPFIVTLDSEQMAVTGISGNTLTVTRGYRGTTAASHNDAVPIIVSGLNGYRGQAVSGWIHGTFVSDQSDDYEPRMLDADEGYAVASFQVQVIHE